MCSFPPRDEAETAESRVLLRIGVNSGDVVAADDGDLFGDGVNIAARLEGIADPGGIAISGKVYGKLTLTFEDRGEHALKNIGKLIQVYAYPAATASVYPISRQHLPLPDKPSIAVLPFENLSGDAEQGYFADGIVEEIITALLKVSGLFVIARNSSFAYRGKVIDVRQVGRELGVRALIWSTTL